MFIFQEIVGDALKLCISWGQELPTIIEQGRTVVDLRELVEHLLEVT